MPSRHRSARRSTDTARGRVLALAAVAILAAPATASATGSRSDARAYVAAAVTYHEAFQRAAHSRLSAEQAAYEGCKDQAKDAPQDVQFTISLLPYSLADLGATLDTEPKYRRMSRKLLAVHSRSARLREVARAVKKLADVYARILKGYALQQNTCDVIAAWRAQGWKMSLIGPTWTSADAARTKSADRVIERALHWLGRFGIGEADRYTFVTAASHSEELELRVERSRQRDQRTFATS